MATWKEQNSRGRDPWAADSGLDTGNRPESAANAGPWATEGASDRDTGNRSEPSQRIDFARKNADQGSSQSVIANGLTVEGRIEGTGDLRIAGNFQGDVNVRGNLTIEVGAKLTGAVRANMVVIAGELHGNVDQARRVELLESGVLDGNLKAESITVAAGSRMRGQLDFGWEDQPGASETTGS